MVGRLTEERRDQMIRMLLGLVRHEPARVADVMLDWSGDSTVDEAALLLEIQTFVACLPKTCVITASGSRAGYAGVRRWC